MGSAPRLEGMGPRPNHIDDIGYRGLQARKHVPAQGVARAYNFVTVA